MTVLDQADLYDALTSPVMRSISFLNEVMTRFPDAVSFAPGAPNLVFLDEFDAARHIDRYLRYLRDERGMDPARARRLLCEYGPSRGLINDVIAEALRRDHGRPVAPQHIVVTVGAQEAMLLALRAVCRDARDILAVHSPCFAGIVGAAKVLGVETVAVPETDGGLDLAGLAAACQAARCTGRRLRACYVAPDYANPSGTFLDLPVRQRLLDLAAQEDLLLLEDNAYGFTAAPEAELPTLKLLDQDARVLYLATFAKVCLPGARVGFVHAETPVRAADGTTHPLADDIAALKSMVTVNTSPICQAVVAGMLLEHGGSLRELGLRKGARYRRGLRALLDALDRHLGDADWLPPTVRWNRPTGGFFVRMRLPIRADLALLETCAAEFGVLWTPMSQFCLDDACDNELRLSCSYLTDAQIEEGVARLARFLRSVLGRRTDSPVQVSTTTGC